MPTSSIETRSHDRGLVHASSGGAARAHNPAITARKWLIVIQVIRGQTACATAAAAAAAREDLGRDALAGMSVVSNNFTYGVFCVTD